MIRLWRISLTRLYSPMTFVVWVVSSFLVTFAAPFGSYEMHEFGWRLLYWSVVILASSNVGVVCGTLADRLAGRKRPLASDLLAVALMALVFSPVVWGFSMALYASGTNDVPDLLLHAKYVAVITAFIRVFRRMLPGFRGVGYFGTGSAAPNPRLVLRLPDSYQGPILRLTVRDHCVDVVTARKTHTIRMRFSDAIDEMGTIVGFCTHRSHWVVRRAITGVERQGGKTLLRLSNDDLVPVSRKYKPELLAAGVL